MNKYFMALLAGVTVGILIAPAKGSRTRRNILDKLNDLNDIITDESEGPQLVLAEMDRAPAGLEAPIAPLK